MEKTSNVPDAGSTPSSLPSSGYTRPSTLHVPAPRERSQCPADRQTEDSAWTQLIVTALALPFHPTKQIDTELRVLYNSPLALLGAEKSYKSLKSCRFRRQWRKFADELCTQWQMINYVSAVFIGTIATMLQDRFVSGSPMATSAAIIALLCALPALIYGVILQTHLSGITTRDDVAWWLNNFQRLKSYSLINPTKILVLPLAWLLRSATFFTLALFFAYVWSPDLDPAMRRHPAMRAAMASVFLAWAVQTPAVVWALRRLRRRPAQDSESALAGK